MIILYAVFVATLIVSGQALWKVAIDNLNSLGLQLFTAQGIVRLMTSPTLIAGVLIYGLATVAYIYILGKYNYFQIQSIVVGSSLVLTLILAITLFDERPHAINVIGVALIVVGSLFVVAS